MCGAAGPPPGRPRHAVIRVTTAQRYTDATAGRMSGIRDHKTAISCTSFHKLQAAAVFYPIFSPKWQHNGIERLSLLVMAPS